MPPSVRTSRVVAYSRGKLSSPLLNSSGQTDFEDASNIKIQNLHHQNEDTYSEGVL